jgi:hypothetical protein
MSSIVHLMMSYDAVHAMSAFERQNCVESIYLQVYFAAQNMRILQQGASRVELHVRVQRNSSPARTRNFYQYPRTHRVGKGFKTVYSNPYPLPRTRSVDAWIPWNVQLTSSPVFVYLPTINLPANIALPTYAHTATAHMPLIDN